jgi:GAF domain-containing protein
LNEERHTEELAALYAVSAAMNQALNEGDALKQALGRVLKVLHLESGKIYLMEPQTGQLVLTAAQGNPELLNPGENAITPGECLCGLAAQTGDLHQTADPATEPRVMGHCRHHSGYACAAVPLLAKEHTLGILHVARRQEAGFSEGDVVLLGSIGAQIGIAVENMRLREEARRAEALSTLIQEMHHRIKNNLQTVADLLSLEMSSSSSPEARKKLAKSWGIRVPRTGGYAVELLRVLIADDESIRLRMPARPVDRAGAQSRRRSFHG